MRCRHHSGWVPHSRVTAPEVGIASVTDFFEDVQPERSLLLSYATAPQLFESVLLKHLQLRGAGEVTILVDANGYRSALLEAGAVRWAGVHYRYYPVRLPRYAAAFHPKLYLAAAPEGLSLLVASANLTPSSLYENAEVADLLTLDREGRGDVQAFSDLHGLLEALLELPSEYLSGDARTSVSGFVDEIARLVMLGREDSGVRLLHTASRPLLSQVSAAIPVDEVREIVCISPFFDGECRAVQAIASAYPTASLRVITRLEPTDLHHDHLASLAGRLEVFGLDSPLRLHGKAFLFRAPTRSWLIVGSANLTAPAWLSGMQAGGNLEAVAVREGADEGAFDAFLDDLDLTKIPLPSLQGRATTEGGQEDEGGETFLALGDVMEEDRGIRIVAYADPSWHDARYEVWVEAPEVYRSLEVTAVSEGDYLVLRARTPPEVFESDGAFLVRVRLHHPSGLARHGAAWLHRREMIALPSRERRLRRAVALLDESGWSDAAGDYGALVDLWRMSVEEMAPTPAPQQDEEVLAEEAAHRTSWGTGAASRTRVVEERLASRRRVLRRAADSLYRVLIEPAVLGQSEDLDDAADEELAIRRTWEAAEREVPRKERAASLVHDESLVHAVSDLFRPIPSTESVPDILLRMDVLVRLLLQRYARQVEDPVSHPEFMRFHLRRTLRHAFSIGGAEYGNPEGWFVRAWTNPSLRDAVREEMGLPARRASFLACLVLGAEDPGAEEGDVDRSSLRGLLAGMDLVSDGALSHEARALDEFGRLMDSLNQQAQSLPGGELSLRTLERLVAVPIPLLEVVRRFEPILRYERGEPVPGDISGVPRLIQTYVRVRRAKEKRGEKPLALARAGTDRSRTCGGCWMSLPPAMEESLLAEENGVQCPHCGRLLLPFDHEQETVVTVLRVLDRYASTGRYTEGGV